MIAVDTNILVAFHRTEYAHRVKCLWTADRDFSRFPSLKCRNPLADDE